jgi:hypothetical protein
LRKEQIQEFERKGLLPKSNRGHGRHTMRMTTPQLIIEINESIREFSLALRPLAEDAGRRLTDGEHGESLKKAFSYATHVLAYIENEKPK